MGKIKIDKKDTGSGQTQPQTQPPPPRQDYQSTPQQPAEKKPTNKTLWRILLLPSILILAGAIALYVIRPLRDTFISGQVYNSYAIYGTYAAWSPKFWMIGLSSILFAVMLIISIGKTVARREWGYWQRLTGLIALTAAGVVLILIGLPEIGTDARDAGSTELNGHYYHLLVQQLPATPDITLRFSIFDCDATAMNCARVQSDDIDFRPGDRIPALELIRITTDGPLVVTQDNTTSVNMTQYRPQ